jgi:H+/gluconate symporter-like permease
MGLIGILLGLALLIWLALRGWSVLLLAPAAALLAAAFALEPLLANWTQTFMGSAATFLAQFFPLFLLGALFGKLMDDSGCVSAIAGFMTERLGERRAVLAVVLAGALVTYGGVSLFVAFFVLVPVGFGAVVAALPAFAAVRDWVLSMEGGPLVSLAVATNVLAALTGSTSGGLTIALDALGSAYMELAVGQNIDPALMHRVAVIGSGTLDSLPHNGAVVTLLALCGSTHRESYFDVVMVAIVGAIIALVAVIALGSAFGSL